MTLVLWLRKLLQILRADARPRQVAFGVSLGLLLGLPPLGLQSLAVVLAFLLVSAHLGAFLLAAGVAGALALVFQDALRSVGRSVLHAEPMRGFLETVLHWPVVEWFGLDRYVAMGGTVVGLVAAVLAWPVALVVVEPLRRGMARAFEGESALARVTRAKPVQVVSRLLLGKKKPSDPDKKVPWLRRGFLWPVGLFGVLVVGGWWMFGDGLVRAGLERMAAGVTGKEVSIQSASFGALQARVDLTDLVVDDAADDETERLAEGQEISFDLGLAELMDRHVVIDQASVLDLTVKAESEDAPPVPGDDEPGEDGVPGDGGEGEGGEEEAEEGITVRSMLEWWEAHERQVRWAVEGLDQFLRSEPGVDEEAPGFEERAAWVYAQAERPFFQARQLEVRNLAFDWGSLKGPVAALRQLDLMAEGFSSAPTLHDQPISFQAEGLFGAGTIELGGMFDVRSSAERPRKEMTVRIASDAFDALKGLGLAGTREAVLDLRMSGSGKLLDSFTCEGHFIADNPGRVSFQYGHGEAKTLAVSMTGFDASRFGAWSKPGAVQLEGGSLELGLDVTIDGPRLNGSLAVMARDLVVSPGRRSSLAGLNAGVVCDAIHEVTKTTPLALTFDVAGNRRSPKLSMNSDATATFVAQLRAGLEAAGRAALLNQLDQQIGKLEGELASRIAEQLDGRLPDALKELPLLDGAAGAVEEQVGGAAKEALEKGAGGLLDRVLGGKKKKDDG